MIAPITGDHVIPIGYSVSIQPDHKIIITGALSRSPGGCTGMARLDPGVLGINNLTFATIKAFPNPTKDKIYFTGEKMFTSAAVYNYLGQEVFAKSLRYDEQELDLSGLQNGVYLVKLQGASGNGVVKVIKGN